MNLHRRHGLLGVTALGGLFATGTAWARTPASKRLDNAALTAIVERATGGKVEHIGPGPLPGLNEAIVRGKVFYIDDAGEYMIEGHIVDLANRRSLTAQREAEHMIATTPVLRLSELDLGDAITVVRGERREGRVLVSFEDPRCGFCMRLHVTLKDAKDLTLHTFPVSFLGPESRALNERIWCSPLRAQAWETALADRPVSGGSTGCDLGALDRNMALAERFRVQGTPTLFTAQGRRINGAASLAAIEAALSAQG